MSDIKIVEVRTKEEAEKALGEGCGLRIVAGAFVLSLVNISVPIIVQGDARPSIETRGTSAPRIETWGTSAPSIETWETSAPRIVTWGTSAPRINNSDNPVPLIFLSGFRWRITISAERMAIGCQDHELACWWAFDDRLIQKMDPHALEFWHANKAHLQAICAATGRVSGLEVEAAQ